jgi:hypothetical protein
MKRTIGYASNAWGYVVQVYENGNVIHEYRAGNHRGDSKQTVPLTSPWVEKPETLAKYAKQSALELATDFSVAKTDVQCDSDLKANLDDESEPRFSSITVLSDGETFTSTNGCVVCQYDDNSGDFFDDADELIDLVKDGSVKGRILNVDALVKLYDAVQALELDTVARIIMQYRCADLEEIKKQAAAVLTHDSGYVL